MTRPDDRTKMRRDDRSRDEDWIRDYLTKAPFCSVATVTGDQPFLTFNTFVYDPDQHAIYLHTAARGQFRSNSEETNKVCLAVGEMGRLIPAKVAKEFSVEYKSVVVFGTISIIEDRKTARDALQILLDKYFGHLQPGDDYRPITPYEVDETAVYRIDIEAWSGKEKHIPDDTHGAFVYKS
jgi:nitroimidazol reductase NimA-like FMN-containing flavoprotein (pyridoxamine 5'-phosphate oxidase superfamily)